MSELAVSVIVITLNRPEYVRTCLRCLSAQSRLAEQVIVVDASADRLTQEVVAEFSGVEYYRNETGFGRMTTSRNIGLLSATGDVIAFVDDDAYAHPEWLANLLQVYSADLEGRVGAVGGRALNGVPGEESCHVADVGRLTRAGVLAGYFAADTRHVIDVDHVMGCNMSFRREVLARLRGFREDYPGVSGVCEDSDMCVRVRRLGYKIRFSPHAVVDHVGAPQAVGRRFDARYAYYGQRNHVVLLIRNFGLLSTRVWLFLLYSVFRDARRVAGKIVRRPRAIGSALAGAAADLGGSIVGLGFGIRLLLMSGGRNPIRQDRESRKLEAVLSSSPARPATPRQPAPEVAASIAAD